MFDTSNSNKISIKDIVNMFSEKGSAANKESIQLMMKELGVHNENDSISEEEFT